MKNNRQLQLLDTGTDLDDQQEGLPEEHEHYLDHITGQTNQHDDEPARGRKLDDDDDVISEEDEEERR